jgi:bifunctional UDP-N-acetylglucosamine pyrophosphorylase/glucosamine-1-phosphate N-acetyltransferase
VGTENDKLVHHLKELSSPMDLSQPDVAIILAAGHGKRIKSETSKMLHLVWGVPTVVRVANAARRGLGSSNQILVVGIKAREVAEAVGPAKNRAFVYQPVQNGTGDATRIALEQLPEDGYEGNIFIFPGDMGLLDEVSVRTFKEDFLATPCDMMVLTGTYEGDPALNYYGRIVRVPEKDITGLPSGDDHDKVIEIKEHKDILALSDDAPYEVVFNGRRYSFTKEELLNIREFNTGVYAFRSKPLSRHIRELDADNVQGELYVTDLIAIFNRHKLSVKASPAPDNRRVLGFNVKSVLKEMEVIAREDVYNRLKDIITIEDKDDFFIADEVAEQIIELDSLHAPLDIVIGKGVHLGPNVRLSKGVVIKNYAYLDGNIELGERVVIHESVHLSTYSHQQLKVGNHSEILQGDIVKGNLTIGENCRIESSVNMTGSDEYPTRIGDNVLIKGTSYIFGSIIENDIWIEHSVLKCKYVERTVRKDGSVQPIRYVIPLPEGLDSIHDLSSNDR